MNQIFTVSGLSDLMALVAAVDAGLFGTHRRMLLVSNEARIPELAPRLESAPGFKGLAGRFDEVRSWNEVIAPLHPSGWTPRSEDRPLLDRMFRRELGLDGDAGQLILGSGTAAPGRALAMVFREWPVIVCSADLRAYGPTSATLPTGMSSRIERLIHLDLVPGVRPQLLAEYGVPAESVPAENYLDVLGEAGSALPAHPVLITGRLPGQDVLRGVAALGHAIAMYVPDPFIPARLMAPLGAAAEELGMRLEIADDQLPAEVWCAAVRPDLVVGSGGSAALLVASRYLGLQVAGTGTRRLLDRLVPYEHEDRIPLTIVDALLPQLSADGTLSTPLIAAAELEPLLTAVGYLMRPGSRPELRQEAIAYFQRQPEPPPPRGRRGRIAARLLRSS